ncbi:MAG: hypothetical protein RL115_2544 [Bacteroidota bacterium]|jgi:hypothetical protein
MKKLLFLFTTLSLFIAAKAQNDFLLYSFKGNVSVVENNAESKAKVGKPLNSAATVKVGAASAITLICNEAAMFTINKAGTYKLSTLGDSCRVAKGSVSANYVKYVWAQMTKPSGSAGSNRKAYMNNVGAVTRDINVIWVDPKLDTVNFVGGDFPLSWKCYSDANEFDFRLYNADNLMEPFYKTGVSKKKVPIASFASKIKPGNTYFWIAAVKGEENETRKVINYIAKETYAALLADLKKQAAAYEGPAEQAYRLGFMLEDLHFLSEAHQFYTQATKLDPKNGLYLSTLMSFRKDYEIK